MRIGILSDLHANLMALEAMDRYLAGKVDALWILGDLLGYGPRPLQTLHYLHGMHPAIMLTGNHDWYVTPLNDSKGDSDGRLSGPRFRRGSDGRRMQIDGPRLSAWEIALRHRASLDPQVIDWLAAIPSHIQVGDSIMLAHAIFPRDETDITSSLITSVKRTQEMPSTFVERAQSFHATGGELPFLLHIGGHTHLRAAWGFSLSNEQPNWEQFPTDVGQPIPLSAGYAYHFNPGSVGFPGSPYQPCPSCLLLDTDALTMTFFDVPYDSERVRDEMISLGYPQDVWGKEQFYACS